MKKKKSEIIILNVKNMVCPRCISVVRDELRKAGCVIHEVQLGKATVAKTSGTGMGSIQKALEKHGFELLQSPQEILVEQVKVIIVEQVHHSHQPKQENYSDLLANKLGKPYSYLSKIFSDSQRISIKRFILLQKVEKVKELLEDSRLTLSEIANCVGYSHVHHLSSQFKRFTGVSATEYKHGKKSSRKYIDNIS